MCHNQCKKRRNQHTLFLIKRDNYDCKKYIFLSNSTVTQTYLYDFDRDFYNNVFNIKTYEIKGLEKDHVYSLNIYWVCMVISIVAMLAFTYQTDQMLCSAKCSTSGMLCVFIIHAIWLTKIYIRIYRFNKNKLSEPPHVL